MKENTECEYCFNSKEVFNGKEMIPCPKCTDPTYKDKDYQSKIIQNVTSILEESLLEPQKDENNIESS